MIAKGSRENAAVLYAVTVARFTPCTSLVVRAYSFFSEIRPQY